MKKGVLLFLFVVTSLFIGCGEEIPVLEVPVPTPTHELFDVCEYIGLGDMTEEMSFMTSGRDSAVTITRIGSNYTSYAVSQFSVLGVGRTPSGGMSALPNTLDFAQCDGFKVFLYCFDLYIQVDFGEGQVAEFNFHPEVEQLYRFTVEGGKYYFFMPDQFTFRYIKCS